MVCAGRNGSVMDDRVDKGRDEKLEIQRTRLFTVGTDSVTRRFSFFLFGFPFRLLSKPKNNMGSGTDIFVVRVKVPYQ